MLPWKAPNDPKTLPMGILHDYKSCWTTLGPFGYPRGAQKGPFGLKQTLTGRKASERPRGAGFGPNYRRLVQRVWSHGNHTFLPGFGPLLAPWGPKRASFGPKCPFWGPQRSQEGPRGQNLVLTATGCSARVKLMVTTHFGLVSVLFWAPRGPKRASFGPKCPFLGPEIFFVGI